MLPSESAPTIEKILSGHAESGREAYWSRVLRDIQAKAALEVGVWKGTFAEMVLTDCPLIERYYMLDPWRHLDEWNKPFNLDQPRFEEIFAEAVRRTDFANHRRVILRGTSIEMIDRIPDESLDFAYIDGDHTLRGIAIDLIRTFPKVRPGGVLGGDDYAASIWQHGDKFEPSLVCPFAAYFAESVGATMIIQHHNQFAIIKPASLGGQFRLIDTTGLYGSCSLIGQVRMRKVAPLLGRLKQRLRKRASLL